MSTERTLNKDKNQMLFFCAKKSASKQVKSPRILIKNERICTLAPSPDNKNFIWDL